MTKKRTNKCPHYDEHWGCAISPMKHCSGCANAIWETIDEEQPKLLYNDKYHTVPIEILDRLYAKEEKYDKLAEELLTIYNRIVMAEINPMSYMPDITVDMFNFFKKFGKEITKNNG